MSNPKRYSDGPHWTKDYDMFEHSKFNRDVRKHKALIRSMKSNGYSPADPIHCVRGADGKIVIKRGHHRLEAAKQLGLEVCYVVFEDANTIAEWESTNRKWNTKDYVTCHARAGDMNYLQAVEYARQTGITVSQVINMLANAEGTPSLKSEFKEGYFEIKHQNHFDQVRLVTAFLREMNIPYATDSKLVSAISLAVHVENFDAASFVAKMRKNMQMIHHGGSKDGFLMMIENIYNHNCKFKVPVRLEAMTALTERKKTQVKKTNANDKKSEA